MSVYHRNSGALAGKRRGKLVRIAAILICALNLAACSVELFANLDQKQANDIVATLFRHGIPAQRSIGKNGRYAVNVDQSRFSEAVAILNDNGLPKQDFATLGEVFKNEGIVASPVQERAQMIYALSQELARTVSDIDGVLSARVHLVLPENDPLRQQLIPSSASVFIRHVSTAPLNELVPQVKMLVANGVAGLSYDKVSVVLIPVTVRDRDVAAMPNRKWNPSWACGCIAAASPQAEWMFFGLLALLAALCAGDRRIDVEPAPAASTPCRRTAGPRRHESVDRAGCRLARFHDRAGRAISIAERLARCFGGALPVRPLRDGCWQRRGWSDRLSGLIALALSLAVRRCRRPISMQPTAPSRLAPAQSLSEIVSAPARSTGRRDRQYACWRRDVSALQSAIGEALCAFAVDASRSGRAGAAACAVRNLGRADERRRLALLRRLVRCRRSGDRRPGTPEIAAADAAGRTARRAVREIRSGNHPPRRAR